MNQIIKDFIFSWKTIDGVNSLDNILNWIDEKNKNTIVKIKKISLDKCQNWFKDEKNYISNINGDFFSIRGLKIVKHDSIIEQPIIYQDEIGYLGIICKKIDGVLHFLMQAKIEPGNINKIQLSPTIQATKSNFEQKHGGKKPSYLDFFLNADKYNIIVDQIQSEQASRLYKKRNRNIIIYVDDDINVLPSHKWVTLGQIKQLMKIDNLVNMDTRTVLSCIPFSIYNEYDSSLIECFKRKEMFNSIFNNQLNLSYVFRKINNYKMFNKIETSFCGLDSLKNWEYKNDSIICKKEENFKIIFCDLEIEGREVKKWCQPLLEATGIALFVLFCANFNGKINFLVKLKPEIGNFDKVELGPTIQNESTDIIKMPNNFIDEIYMNHIKKNQGIIFNALLSEEGGRFYQEQNRNVIIEVDYSEIKDLPDDFLWLDFKTLNYLIQFNNVVNIQLRNLLSLLEI